MRAATVDQTLSFTHSMADSTPINLESKKIFFKLDFDYCTFILYIWTNFNNFGENHRSAI